MLFRTRCFETYTLISAHKLSKAKITSPIRVDAIPLLSKKTTVCVYFDVLISSASSSTSVVKRTSGLPGGVLVVARSVLELEPASGLVLVGLCNIDLPDLVVSILLRGVLDLSK